MIRSVVIAEQKLNVLVGLKGEPVDSFSTTSVATVQLRQHLGQPEGRTDQVRCSDLAQQTLVGGVEDRQELHGVAD